MMLAARGAIRASGAGLPYDAEVEYLESSGTQYIDTGYSFNSATDKVELVFELLTTTPNYKWIFGAYDASKRLAIGSGDGGRRRTLGYNASTSYNSSTYYTDGAHIFLADSTGASIDGHNFFGFADFSTTSHIILYSIPIDPSTYSANARIWSYKHYRNGTLVRDYIPVRKGNVGYLYDRVSGKLFGNAGTGDFALGPDVVPVEYIESTGTQYIDTGVVPGPGLDYSISFAFTSMSSYSYIMGAWSSNNSNYYDLAEQSNTLIYAGLGTTQKAIANVPVGVFSTAEKRGLEIYIDGVKKNTFPADVQSGSISSTILLFGVHRNYGPGYIVASQPLRVSKYSLTLNGTDIRKFLPVRVGTGSTWEGATIDTLTRRVYRNAGTGAFTFGNDLKYPIPA